MSQQDMPGEPNRRVARRRALVTLAAATMVVAAVIGLSSGSALAASTHFTLASGAGAPSASGSAQVELDEGVLQGSVKVRHLPAQEFGSGRFYGVWFVRTDTGDKAFLGALVQHNSIIFSKGGEGRASFAGTKFTTGPDAGSPIKLGAHGTNLLIVLVENNINGLTPSPVGPVPGVGVAVSGTF